MQADGALVVRDEGGDDYMDPAVTRRGRGDVDLVFLVSALQGNIDFVLPSGRACPGFEGVPAIRNSPQRLSGFQLARAMPKGV